MGILSQCENGVSWQFNGENLQIIPWGENSLRVRSVIFGEVLDTDYALLPQNSSTPKITVTEQEATIQNGKICAKLIKNNGTRDVRIAFYNQNGDVLLEEISDGGALTLRARNFKPMIGGDFQLTASFCAQPDEKLYGMGQYQQEVFDLKGCKLELAHRNSQASVPFVLSSKGYGFLWHNPAIGSASFNHNQTEWYAQSTKQLDYWITAGDTPAEIISAYAGATGKAPMMPEYGLGFWQCKLRYWNQEQLLEVAREYKRRQLPIDVIVCDFFHWPKMGDFRFEEEFFPDPKAMVDELKEMGIELMVSVWPQIDHRSENFNEMRDNGYLVRVDKGVPICMRFQGESVFFDATNPKARNYVWDKCKRNYYDYGIRVFWLDEAEPEFLGYDFDNYRYFIGPNAQVGNVYPQLFSRTFYEGMENAGQSNIVNLVRCAWAGSQRYGALVWSGDIHSTFAYLRMQVCAGLHMGIAGIPWWTTDIGGFSGGNPDDPAFRELLIRWFQYGTFCPVMRLHGDRIPSSVPHRKDGSETLFTGADNEVWSFGEEAYPILVKHMQFREKMRPYTRRLMQEAHETGAPVMRTMFYAFPNDKLCWDIWDQYLYGGDLLVAPILAEGQRARAVYLPEGEEWESLADNAVYQGGQTITVDAPIDTIPLFIRKGADCGWLRN